MTSGRLVFDGPVNDSISQYRQSLATEGQSGVPSRGQGYPQITINGDLNPIAVAAQPHRPLRIDLAIDRAQGAHTVDVTLNVVIETPDGRVAIHLRNDLIPTALSLESGPNLLSATIEDLPLAPGSYWLWLRVVLLDLREPLIVDTDRVLLTVAGEQAAESIVVPRHHFEQVSAVAAGAARPSARTR